jgi:hypothetical protein
VGALVHYVSQDGADEPTCRPASIAAIGNYANDLWLDLSVSTPGAVVEKQGVARSLGADEPGDVFPGYTIATCHDGRFYPGGTWHWPGDVKIG